MLYGLAATVAGCASGPRPATVPDEADYGWTYRTSYGIGDPERPIAIYGPPESAALLILECDPAARLLHLLMIDVDPFEGMRPIVISAHGAVWLGQQRLEQPDGSTIARASIPLGHAVLDSVAAARTPIVIEAGGGRSALRADPVAARVVRECRAAAPG